MNGAKWVLEINGTPYLLPWDTKQETALAIVETLGRATTLRPAKDGDFPSVVVRGNAWPQPVVGLAQVGEVRVISRPWWWPW